MCVCVCVCVCVSVYLSVCLSSQPVTLELLKLGTFSVCGYILTISRSSLSTKVMGQGQCKMYILLYFSKIVNFMCFYSTQT